MTKPKPQPSPFSLKRQVASLDKPFEVILNKCHGGWGLSLEAIKWLVKTKNINVGITVNEKRKHKPVVKWVRYPDQTIDMYFDFDLEIFESYSKDPNFREHLHKFITRSWHFNHEFSMNFLRTHPDIIECIKTLSSKKASGESARLEIETIHLDFEVQCSGGYETLGFIEEYL